jgi:GTP-binding protein
MTMEVHNVDLTISAVSDEQYPNTPYPEIALVGRSNVGKSSLTNVLINRRNFAHTSSQPGKTQTLNFYNVEEQLYFVDVPGYGYAKVSKKERERFGQMIEQYLTQREQLQGVIELVDARHAPTADDVDMYNWLRYYNLPTLIVGTKIDKVKASAWNKQVSLIKKTLQADNETPIILFSAATKKGKNEVWQWIEERMGKN